MKTLIAAGLALALLGGTAAEAAPFHRDAHAGFRGGAARHEVAGRGFDRGHHWVRGERLSPRFGRYVAVNNWNHYHLRRPPHGYHWVRYGNDFVLAAIASGLIADFMVNGAYGY